MALQKSITLPSGVTAPEAYIKIVGGSLEAIRKIMMIRINIYLSAEAAGAGNSPILVKQETASGSTFDTYFGISVLDQENVNIISKAYDYIKTITTGINYSDAIDV